MAKASFTLYDKKSFIEHLEKAIPNDLIISMTNSAEQFTAKPKFGTIAISFAHAGEFFKVPDSIGPLLTGAIPFSFMLCKKEIISKEYLAKLKKDKGMTGFSIG